MICKHCKKSSVVTNISKKGNIKGSPKKYCSKKCKRAAGSKRKKPLSHVVIYRKVIVNYLGNRCAKCGITENLQIHHIKPRYLGGEDKMNNLTLLCAGHHGELHSELYKKY